MDRAIPTRRSDAIQAQAQRHSVAGECQFDSPAGQGLSFSVEKRLNRQCSLVPRALRPTGVAGGKTAALA